MALNNLPMDVACAPNTLEFFQSSLHADIYTEKISTPIHLNDFPHCHCHSQTVSTFFFFPQNISLFHPQGSIIPSSFIFLSQPGEHLKK